MQAPRSEQPPLVIVACAPEDRASAKGLRQHLTVLERQKQMRLWDDSQILAGEAISQAWQTSLERADVLIALLSAAFLNDEHCRALLEEALQRQQGGRLRLLPVRLRPVDLTGEPVSQLQSVPRDGSAILAAEGTRRDEAWLLVVEELGLLLAKLQEARLKVPTGNNSLEDRLLAGVPPRWTPCLRQLLASYLGTPEQPVVFCGRNAHLEALDAWLEAPGPARRLLMAPGGRGKSALLLRWALQLEDRGIAVAWVPVSVRFGLQQSGAVWSTLADRLARLHREPPPTEVAEHGQALERIHDHLRRPLEEGRQRVVLLDGLDEAGWEVDASMLPVRLAENTRLLVAVRGEGERDGMRWLRRLGWEREGLDCRIALPPLDRDAVGQGLAALALPLGALDAARVREELYRVSVGDPLVLQLMLDELRKVGCVGVLGRWQGLSPGLNGYMEGWWEQQRALWGDRAPQHAPALGTLLDLLAVALAPLTDDDLLALAPEELPNHYVLESAFQWLERLVIGDGQRGRVFTHPGLTSYFWGRLPPGRRAAIEECFVARGRAVLTELNRGQRSPQAAPRYVIMTQRAHLERTQVDVDALLALVSDGWRAAWEAMEGGLAGFLADVRAAWRKLAEVQAQEARTERLPRRWAEELRCALVQASIGSLNERLPERLLALLLEEKRWTPGQALLHAQQCPDAQNRDKLLQVVFAHLPDALLDEALEAGCAVAEAPWGSFEALKELIPRLTARQPEALLARIEHLSWRLSVLEEMAKHCTGALREAVVSVRLDHARRLEDPRARSYHLGRAAEHEAGERRAALTMEAWETTRLISSMEQRFHALERLLPLVPEALREEVERAAITAVLAMHEELIHPTDLRTATALGYLRLLKLSPEAVREAREAAWKLVQDAPPIERIPALLALAKWTEGDERRQALCKLLEALPHLNDQKQRAQHLLEMVELEPALLSLVLAEAQRLTKPDLANVIRLRLVGHLPPEEQPALWPLVARRGDSWTREQWQILRQFPPAQWAERLHEMEMPAARARVALVILEEEKLDEEMWMAVAREAVRELDLLSPHSRVDILRDLFFLHPSEPLLDAFLTAVSAIEDRYVQSRLLDAVWPRLRSPNRERVLQQAIDAARASPEPRTRAGLMTRIAQTLGQEGEQEAAGLWQELLADWSGLDVHQLVDIAEHTRGALREEALDKALRVLRRPHSFTAMGVLRALAPHWPESMLVPRFDRLLAQASAAGTLDARFWHWCVSWLPASLRAAYWPRIRAAAQRWDVRERLREQLSLMHWAPPAEQQAETMVFLQLMEEESERLAALPLDPRSDSAWSQRHERPEREEALARAIVTLAASSSAAGLEERLVALAQKLGMAETRVRVFADLAQRLPLQTTELREMALRAMEELSAKAEGEDGAGGTPYDVYTRALSVLLPLVSDAERRRLLARAVQLLDAEARWQTPEHIWSRRIHLVRLWPAADQEAEAHQLLAQAALLPRPERLRVWRGLLEYLGEAQLEELVLLLPDEMEGLDGVLKQLAPEARTRALAHIQERLADLGPEKRARVLSVVGDELPGVSVAELLDALTLVEGKALLERLVPRLDAAQLERALALVKSACGRKRPFTEELALLAQILIRLLDQRAPPYALLYDTVHWVIEETSRTQTQLLPALTALAPWWLRLGVDTAAAVVDEVLAVGAWRWDGTEPHVPTAAE